MINERTKRTSDAIPNYERSYEMATLTMVLFTAIAYLVANNSCSITEGN